MHVGQIHAVLFEQGNRQLCRRGQQKPTLAIFLHESSSRFPAAIVNFSDIKRDLRFLAQANTEEKGIEPNRHKCRCQSRSKQVNGFDFAPLCRGIQIKTDFLDQFAHQCLDMRGIKTLTPTRGTRRCICVFLVDLATRKRPVARKCLQASVTMHQKNFIAAHQNGGHSFSNLGLTHAGSLNP